MMNTKRTMEINDLRQIFINHITKINEYAKALANPQPVLIENPGKLIFRPNREVIRQPQSKSRYSHSNHFTPEKNTTTLPKLIFKSEELAQLLKEEKETGIEYLHDYWEENDEIGYHKLRVVLTQHYQLFFSRQGISNKAGAATHAECAQISPAVHLATYATV